MPRRKPRAARACGSPRLVRHDELETLSIAHVDCDAFYATIEKRDDPALAAEPVIVGGGKRGVVAAACYVARTYGVKSAMPMFEALRLCPHAKVVRPNMEKYVQASAAKCAQMMLALTPLVEPLSIDEAFLDLSGTERLHGMLPAKALARFAGEVEKKLAHHRFDRAVLQQISRQSRLRSRQAARLCGARRKRSAGFPGAEAGELHFRRRQSERGAAGARRISPHRRPAGVERNRTDAPLRRGRPPPARLARGIDERKVSADRETKSVSSETTFERDICRFPRAGTDSLGSRRRRSRRG